MNSGFKKSLLAVSAIIVIVSEIFLNFNSAGAYQNFGFTQSDFSGTSSMSLIARTG